MLISPYFALKTIFFGVLRPKDVNYFKKPPPKTSNKRIFFGEDYDRTAMGASCKLNKCSGVVASQAILGQTIGEYLQKHAN